MSEREYPRPALTADVCAFSRDEAGRLHALFIRRGREPFRGQWAFPGGFVELGESAEVAAARELDEETGLTHVALTQVGAFTKPGRDPRGWVVSVAFVADVPWKDTGGVEGGDDAEVARWLEVREADPAALDEGVVAKLAFDHDEILAAALRRLGEARR